MTLLLQFSAIWMRAALALYVAALATAAAAATTRHQRWLAATRATLGAGTLLQLVSLVEGAVAWRNAAAGAQPSLDREITGLLAFIVTVFFLAVYRHYSPRALSLLVLPLTCLLTAAAALAPAYAAASAPAAPLFHNRWILVHVTLIFLGYAGLILAVAAGVLYLVAERTLKSKRAPRGTQLPALETLDHIGYRALLVGFPLLTAGLGIGFYFADRFFGRINLADPTILLALLAWCIYLVLLFARWYSGWRGKRTAYLALICFGLALAGWFANSASALHSFSPR